MTATLVKGRAASRETSPGRALVNAPRILVVDDEVSFAARLGFDFKDEGFASRAVFSAEEALDVVQGWHPHLVVLDVRMPGMDGIECLRLLRARGSPAHPPVLLVTADDRPLVEAATLVYEGCHLLRKPCTRDQIVGLAKRILERSMGRAPWESPAL